ncbi:hypothetical protein Q0P28_13960, partial [Staphylococcus aureus]|nr:hypothetical protein [Staphylococcus aureus]
SSPPPPTSPIPEDDDEEANPFDIAATQAASQGAPLEAEVDADAVAADVSEEPETNDEQVLHEETARLHARQSQQFRATQRVIDEFEL